MRLWCLWRWFRFWLSSRPASWHCDSTIDRLGFFLLSWMVLFLGLVTVLMVRLGLIESSPFSEDFWRVGMLWLVALWSMALADRLNVLKADTERANRDLRTSQNRLAQTIETMPVGVVVYGTDRRAQLFNQHARHVFAIPGQGEAPDTILGSTVAETAKAYSFRVAGTEEAYTVDRLPVIRALRGEHAVVDDLEMDVAGKRIQLEAWAGPIVDDQGNILSAVAAFQDITQRKQAEADLKQHREHLEELVAARTTELSALNQIAHALVTTEDLPSTLDFVVREIAQLFGVALTVVGVVETGEARVVAATYPHQDSGLPELAYLLGDNSILCPLLDEGRALIVPNIQDRIKSPFWRERVHAWNIHVVMLIPLQAQGEVIGFMAVGADDPERCFTPEELSLAETIAADVAGAVENVRLSEQAQKAATITERNRLAQELHELGDPAAVFGGGHRRSCSRSVGALSGRSAARPQGFAAVGTRRPGRDAHPVVGVAPLCLDGNGAGRAALSAERRHDGAHPHFHHDFGVRRTALA